MAANKVEIKVSADTADAEGGIERVSKSLNNIRVNAQRMSLVFGAVAAGLGISLRSFANEALSSQRAMALLQVAVSNTGVPFDLFKERIDKVVAGLRETTAVSKTELEQALGTLVVIIGRTDLALLSLKLALDVSAFTQRELSATTDDLARFLIGLTDTFGQLGLKVDENVGFMSRYQMVLDAVGGSSERLKTPTKELGTAFDEVKETMGGFLLEALDPLITALGKFLVYMNDNHPMILKITAALLAMTAVTAAIAGLTAGIVALSVALVAVGLANLPIVAVAAAIVLVVAAGALLIANWDKVKEAAAATWKGIKEGVLATALVVVGAFEGMVNGIIFLFNKLIDALNMIPGVDIGKLQDVDITKWIEDELGKLKDDEDPYPFDFAPAPLAAMRGPAARGSTGAMAAGAVGGGGHVTVNINGPIYGLLDLDDHIKRVVRNTLVGGGFNGLIGR